MMPTLWIDPNPLPSKSPKEIIQARSGREAIDLLANPKVCLLSTVISTEIKNPGILSLIRQSHLLRPGMPIIPLMASSNESSNWLMSDEMRNLLGIQNALDIHGSPESLWEFTQAKLPHLDETRLLDKLIQSQRTHALMNHGVSNEFLPICINNLVLGLPTSIPVYSKMLSGQYVCILERWQSMEPERLALYLSRKPTSLFVKRVDIWNKLVACDEMALKRHLESLDHEPANIAESERSTD